jgi:hypothetical protein
MTTPTTVDQLQYLFTFPFKDEEWKQKLLIGFLLNLASFIIPIIPWFLFAGYMAHIQRSASLSEEQPTLPAWEDWGDLLMKGLRVVAATFLAMLPFILLFVLAYGAMIVPMFIAELASPGDYEASPSLFTASMLGMFGGMAMFSLTILLGMLTSILLMPAIGHLVVTEEFGALFRIREWWAIFKANFGGYLITYILLMGAWFFMMYAVQLVYMTILLCFLIPFLICLMTTYLGVVAGATLGQAYRVGAEKLEPEPAE